ncbi:MAG: hypothetical protein AAF623_19445, partial [Planctomycetota bacterium]
VMPYSHFSVLHRPAKYLKWDSNELTSVIVSFFVLKFKRSSEGNRKTARVNPVLRFAILPNELIQASFSMIYGPNMEIEPF